MTETLTAHQIIAEDRRRHEVLRRAQREAAVEAAKREREYRESLPRVAYDPSAYNNPTPGVAFVMSTGRVEAFDGRCVYVAAVPGDWVREDVARRLGLDGPAVVLTTRK